MGRHKLAYKLKKPNKHHKYWRYTLSNDPKGRYISARIKVKYAEDMLKVKRGHLLNYLLPEFGMKKLFTITLKDFEDWRNKLNLSNSTKNGITSTRVIFLHLQALER